MRGLGVLRGSALLVCTLAMADDDAPPPLVPPEQSAPATPAVTAPESRQPAPRVAPGSARSPLLRPRTRSTPPASVPRLSPTPTPTPSDGPPPLVGPADAIAPSAADTPSPFARPTARPRVGAMPGRPANPRDGISSGPIDSEPDPLPELGPNERRRARTPAADRERPEPRPERRPGLFGRLFGKPAPSRTRPVDEDPSEIDVEPRADADSEAALKRRLERDIRNALGDRAKSVNVRISGKSIFIRAQATHFWQKRGVKRSLDEMPSIEGYRLHADVD